MLFRAISFEEENPYLLPIGAEGLGYYSYLPALFIYQDASFQFMDEATASHYPDQHGSKIWVVNMHEDSQMNKYLPGASILMAPFFGVAHAYCLLSDSTADGYSMPYQYAIAIAGIFYLILGLFFVAKVLRFFGAKEWETELIILLLGLGSNLLHLVTFESAQSHVYLFFLVSVWVFYYLRWFNSFKFKDLFIGTVVLALIGTIRPQDIILVTLIPFLAGPNVDWKKVWTEVFIEPKKTFLLAILAAAILFLIPLNAFLQTGHWFRNPYAGEYFVWSHPSPLLQLFSYYRGWLTYTPLALISFFGLIGLWRYNRRMAYSAAFFFLSTIYLLSSWWCWYYISAFGQRVYVDFYMLIAILLLFLFRSIEKKSVRIAMISLCALCIPLNMIQNHQVMHGMLEQEGIDAGYYWARFLRLDKRLDFHLPERAVKAEMSFTCEEQSQYWPGLISNEENTYTSAQQEFFGTYQYVFDDTVSVNWNMLRFSAEFKAESEPDVSLIISQQRGSEILVYSRKDLTGYVDLRHWSEIEVGTSLKPIEKGDEIKVYFWNPNSDIRFQVKDMKVQLILHDDPYKRFLPPLKEGKREYQREK